MRPTIVKFAIKKLGSDIKDARRRRRISTTLMAEHARISRQTLYNIEQGHPGVALGHYATVLFILGLIDRLRDLADVIQDEAGRRIEQEHLPQRIRSQISFRDEETDHT